ncbi:DDE_3 domain-containing protein [Trichonephila clavipes]|uniref:DDE_3 domain-containing protein n=1 Tax=Trichonephila clavipes TaxID=2585209 RepID=A0A8X7BLR3_TRICX|nr:DDE_3 domain-containing protein [Trichonephila clavipes]
MAPVFPTENGIFQQNNVSCQKARIVLERFEEHKNEFRLISWPPNSADINLIGNIGVFIVRQLRDQIFSCGNILTLRDHCLDNWYSLSPVIYQEIVVSMPRQVAAVLQVESGATCYWVGVHNVLALRGIIKRILSESFAKYYSSRHKRTILQKNLPKRRSKTALQWHQTDLSYC